VTYGLHLSDRAAKDLDQLDRPTRLRVLERFEQLCADPFDARISALLTNQNGLRKSRIGGWRILFRVNPDPSEVRITTIARRGQVYKRI
jgi:mRNA interferase RelE/StbE